MIYIRTDANKEIATGHVMRCLTIATELVKLGQDICFLMADAEGGEFVRKYGYKYEVLNSAWNNLDEELEDVEQRIKKNNVEAILVDSYYVTKDYLAKLGKVTKVIIIDDLKKDKYTCDMLINYTLYAEDLLYHEIYDENTELLLGNKYVPLRTEFRNVVRERAGETKNIMVLTGGSDNYHVALNVIEAIRENFNDSDMQVVFHVICGAYSVDLSLLREVEHKDKRIHIYSQVTNMSELMSKMDGAIAASGSTLYELCACGVPAIIYTMADNQIRNAEKFAEKHFMSYIGDVRNEIDYTKLVSMVLEMVKDRKQCDIKAKELQRIIDARGAERIAKKIIELVDG